MAKKPTKKDLDLLSKIVEATTSETGMIYLPESDTERLVDNGLAEINVTLKDEAGNVATRATEKGIETMAPNTDTDETAVDETDASAFEIEDGIPLPTIRRGGRGSTMYPFDKLAVGQSFHVAPTEDKPNPAKSLASTVSSATARYAEEQRDENGNVVTKTVKVTTYAKDENGEFVKDENGKRVVEAETEETRPVMVETRKFVVRAVGDEDPKGSGARVFRVA